MTSPVIEPRFTRPARQPRILDRFRDALGNFHIVDEEGETILPPGTGPDQHGQGYTFAVNVDYQGGAAEIRWHSDDDPGNNRSYVWVGLYAHTSGFTTYGNAWFNMEANGSGYTGGNVTIKGSWVLIAARDTWVGHDAAGNATTNVGVHNGEVQGTSFNNAWGVHTVQLTDYTVLPYAPVNLAIAANTVTTTSFGVNYSRNSYDGIDQDQAQWATDAGFGNVVWTDNGPNGYTNPAGVAGAPQLQPGTTHYVRIRSHTGAGWGPWSGTISQTTLPAVPPGFTVASSPSGSQATLSFTPPGGVTGVGPYRYERRATGTTTPVTSKDTSTNVVTETGLIPGNSYDWRASAFIGTYQSPWTEWITLVQAKPNINPGDYFDGGTADTGDLDYVWAGTANASVSRAMAKGVDGWEVDTATSGGAAVLYRVTAGIFGAYAARVQINVDATAAGLRAGQKKGDPYASEVTATASYLGSIHVRPSRSQRLAAEVSWFTSGGSLVSRTVGAASVVAGGTWARLVGGGVAPATAVRAVVRVIDVAGTGWSKWLGGETLDLDGAMVSLNDEFPYFDGSTLADANYIYDWTGTAHMSPSTRTPTAQVQGAFMRELEGLFLPSSLALTDPDCAVVPTPPRPPVVSSPCIDDVGVWRRYYAQIPANLVPDWLDVVPTLDITSGALAARQVRIRYYENPTDAAPGHVDTTRWVSEQIISFMPAHTVLTLDGVTQHVWAEVNGSAPISADHLLYGTNGKPATWPVLSCGIAYLVSIEVPIAEPTGNITVAASLTART